MEIVNKWLHLRKKCSPEALGLHMAPPQLEGRCTSRFLYTSWNMVIPPPPANKSTPTVCHFLHWCGPCGWWMPPGCFVCEISSSEASKCSLLYSGRTQWNHPHMTIWPHPISRLKPSEAHWRTKVTLWVFLHSFLGKEWRETLGIQRSEATTFCRTHWCSFVFVFFLTQIDV